jgi:hypothetical protein
MAGLEHLHPVFADRLLRLSDAVGGLDWTSGYRSFEKQEALFKCWQARRPGCAPANAPGSSNHEAIPKGQPQGLAMDIGRRNRDAARRRAGEFRLHFPISGEPWHCQPVECRSPKFSGVPSFPENDEMTEVQAEQLERILALALNTDHLAVVEIPDRLTALEKRIAELEREFQPPGSTDNKGQAIREELDMLRRDMRKIGEKLGFKSES